MKHKSIHVLTTNVTAIIEHENQKCIKKQTVVSEAGIWSVSAKSKSIFLTDFNLNKIMFLT